jgi:hypothetical protein
MHMQQVWFEDGQAWMDACVQGVTGFHIGKLDLDELVPEDAAAVAKTVAKCAQPAPACLTPAAPHGSAECAKC